MLSSGKTRLFQIIFLDWADFSGAVDTYKTGLLLQAAVSISVRREG
jgi:hypothetical protein